MHIQLNNLDWGALARAYCEPASQADEGVEQAPCDGSVVFRRAPNPGPWVIWPAFVEKLLLQAD